MTPAKRYLLNILIAIDDIGSALTFGDPQDTISSRLGKAHRGDYGAFWRRVTHPLYVLVNWVALHVFGNVNHCMNSIEDDRGKEAV